MANNTLLIDSDYNEANEFIKGLKEINKDIWDIELFENNKIYGIKRYVKFFTVGLKIFLNRKKYSDKVVLCWQQFYGIVIAFFCRLFHVQKKFSLVIMTFIYKEKKGVLGEIFYRFVKYAVTSKYVDKIILTSQGEAEEYSKIFGLSREIFEFVKCGAVHYNPQEFFDQDLVKKNYLFSTGRSNRDYDFLVNALENTKYKLVIACDIYHQRDKDNVKVYNKLFGKDMLRYMCNAKAVVICLDNDKIAAGQLVFLHAMNLGVPVIITKSQGITDDYVIDGYNGLIIEKKRESLLAALKLIDTDKGLYERLKKNSMHEFEENYTYYVMGKNIGEILNRK